MEIAPYGGWDRCLRLTDGEFELFATLQVGPRIIRCAAVGGPNHLVEYREQMGKFGGSEYRSYGGHRLWIAPEVSGRTDLPDNDPVEYRQEDDTHVLTAPPEKTGLQKELRILMKNASVQIEHRIYNHSLYSVEFSPWCLTVMAAGGTAFFPQESFVPHSQKLLPARPLVLWAYTDMSDGRWTWGRRLIRLRQTSATDYQKVGAFVSDGWAAYANHGDVFIKRFPALEGSTYPDFGCNFETFTRHDMLELESLGPLQSVAPGAYAVHHERWALHTNVSVPEEDDAAYELLSTLANAL